MNSDHVLDVLLQNLRNDALGEPTFELAQRRAIGGQRAINLIYWRMAALAPAVTQQVQQLRTAAQIEAQMVLHRAWGFFCEALLKSKEAQLMAFGDGFQGKAAVFSLWETQNAMMALGFLLRELASLKDPMVAGQTYFQGMPSTAEVCEAFAGDKGSEQTVLLIHTAHNKVLFSRHPDGTLHLPTWVDLPRRRFSLVDGEGSIEYDPAPFWCGPKDEAWAYRGLFRPQRRPLGWDNDYPGTLFTHVWVGAEGAPRPLHALNPLVWDEPAAIPDSLMETRTLHILKESGL